MGWTLVVLLVILHFSTTVSVFGDGDDFATKAALPCRRCMFYSVKVGSGGAAVPVGAGAAASLDDGSSGKKTNVGAVVGFTFLLVFMIAIVVLCIYRHRGSPGSPRITTQQPVVVQPAQAQELVQRPARPGVVKPGDARGPEKKEAPREVEPKGRVQVEKVVGKDDDVRKVARPKRPNVGQGQGNNEERRDEKKKEVVGDVERQKQRQVQVEKVVGKDDDVDKVARPRRPNVGQGQGNGERRDVKKKGVVEEVIEPKGDVREGKRRVQAEEVVRKAAENDAKNVRPKRPNVGQGQGIEERRDDKKRKGVVEEVNEPKREELQQQRKNGEDVKGKKPLEVVQEQGGLPKKYTYRFLMNVTNKFDPQSWLGGGAFGTVYKGTLPNGTNVAVKCLKYGGRIEDFLNEVDALGRADHPNLVKLIGYCDEGITQILVYEYVKNGSLNEWIFNSYHNKSLTWPEMKNVILGIARGLEYLHEKCHKKILHRDLKPANIVLDGNKNAKLCDFGFVKQLNKDQSSTSTAWAGTKWYMAPEAKSGRISDRVDVYSFGVVVLEVIFGKRYQYLISSDRTNNTKQVKLNVLVKNLGEDMRKNGKEIVEFGKLAVCCLREKPQERPPMSIVVTAIGAIESRFKEAEVR
ncbi:hypothetical protein vseg_018877 [Gypsophila vaccaria]